MSNLDHPNSMKLPMGPYRWARTTCRSLAFLGSFSVQSRTLPNFVGACLF
jgi:hypothetical protein